ncbi:tetratricopeptide repeat protein 27 isoform X2 [Betta splendens]|uniref:Tetratricopeptide repeat protein 27 n=1 Tax=Betta splendens TaxID=158456 RepID=A0A8M1HPC0_BETSP|nr:tetratricopeptide repeat protein 27 isoform X2 [Betta splendens]
MLLDVELPVLRGFLTESETAAWKHNVWRTAEVASLLLPLMEGEFEKVLQSPQVVALLSGDGTFSEEEDIEAYLERSLLLYINGGPNDGQSNRELVVLALAVSCLHMFVQSNWTGPPVSLYIPDLLPPALISSQHQTLKEAVQSSLLLDGESVYSLVENPMLLLLARVILIRCSSKMESLQLLPWWILRYINLHQQILEARSPQLFCLAQSNIDKVLKHQSVLSEHRHLAIQLHLECAYTSMTYYEYHTASEHIKKAQELSQLNITMTGALGKRTRFQQNDLAQLILDVKKSLCLHGQINESSPTPTPQAYLPKDHCLGDDTVLDAISLAEPHQYKVPDLCAEEQAVILGVCNDFQKNNPVHRLTEEELLAFTSCVLSQPKFWAVEVTALCLRTKLEKGNSRCVERAMMQTQTIVDHFEDKNCSITERLKVFYCCQAPPRWAVRAEEIVRRELKKTATPSLYCLLGDILKDHQYYDQAWEVSGRRSSRAMRSKGLLHLHNKEFQQCIDCFEQSLKINTLQLGLWFSLGCAYIALQGYEGAAKAFQRCVALEPDNAEAWNNLSTAYIRLNKKHKALRSLQEALKCNYEHWQIWENFIAVSTDTGDFVETIKAYHRLMDLRENYKDIQILQILVRAVVENLTDSQGQQAGTLQAKLKELLGRVTSRHSTDAEIWRQYALLYGDGHSSNPEDNEKALQFLSKAHRCQVQLGGWEKDPIVLKEMMKGAINMGEVTISCSKRKPPKEALQMLSSTRLSLRSLATKAKQLHTDVATGQIHNELQDSVASLDQIVTELQELSAKLKDQLP